MKWFNRYVGMMVASPLILAAIVLLYFQKSDPD